jgi:hypothetical protein
MQRIWKIFLAVMFIAALFVMLVPAQAAVARSEALNIITAGNWTNSQPGSPIKLILVEAYGANLATGTVTLTRISNSDPTGPTQARTNSIGSITLAANIGSLVPISPVYLFPGDQVRAVLSAGATNLNLKLTGLEATVRRDALLVESNNATWLNTYGFQAQRLLTIEAFNANSATGTVTLSRISGTQTNTLGTITLAANAGLYTEASAIWLQPGDQIKAVLSNLATNCFLEITKELGVSIPVAAEIDPVAGPVAATALANAATAQATANAAAASTLIAVTATNVVGYSLMTNTVIYLDASTNVATNTTFYLGR